MAIGDPVSPEARQALSAAEARGTVLVSPITAWEIGLLARPGRRGETLFQPDPKAWFARVLASPGFRPAPFDADIAIDSTRLPEPFHADPADRLLVATARHLNARFVTRDRAILDYAALGHVDAVAC